MEVKKSLEKTLIMAENKRKERRPVQERERGNGLFPEIAPFIGKSITLIPPKYPDVPTTQSTK